VAGLDGLWRVRLSSLEPSDVTHELLAAMASSQAVAPHLHLPLQSGSDRVLATMNRPYTAGEFLATCRRVRSALPEAAVSTDIIVGYPGESDEDFERSLAVAREAELMKIHAFPFSPLEGTAAWEHRGQRPNGNVVKARMARLAALEAELAATYRERFIGRSVEAIIEQSVEGRCTGTTDNYLPVSLAGSAEPGQVARLHIVGTTTDGIEGERIDLA
jgi:tRNA A37 methylthiotransferase MiaB